MTNFIFKSPKGLTKNVDNKQYEVIVYKLTIVQKQNRDLRQDMVDIKLMINKLLIDKHLQFQVDNYFEDNNDEYANSTSPQTDRENT